MKKILKIYFGQIKDWWEKNGDRRPYIYGALALVGLVGIYLVSKGLESEKHIFHSKNQVSFEGGKIIGSTDSIFKHRDNLHSRSIKVLEEKQLGTEAKLASIGAQLTEVLARLDSGAQLKGNSEVPPVSEPNLGSAVTKGDEFGPEGGTAAENSLNPFPTQRFESSASESRSSLSPSVNQFQAAPRIAPTGPAVISFPVKETSIETFGVVIPSGSYVKAKVMTGVAAPEGKNYPVLLQLDYAYTGPNRSRIDLTGCFGIAKAQGDLSTERVQMQIAKISCVSNAGRMFEREVNGFVADDADNSFAVHGAINSKQGRVAAMGFISSVVEGIGKAIQQAQTTQQTSSSGETQTLVSGDQLKHAGAGGASSAAAMVTQWYLQQAQNLLPTIEIGSGKDVWIVMQDKVDLPNWYFKKTDGNGSSVYTHISRTVE